MPKQENGNQVQTIGIILVALVVGIVIGYFLRGNPLTSSEADCREYMGEPYDGVPQTAEGGRYQVINAWYTEEDKTVTIHMREITQSNTDSFLTIRVNADSIKIEGKQFLENNDRICITKEREIIRCD